MNLKNKVALITGSSRGIGKAIAESLAKEGAKVIINSKSSVEKGLQLVKDLNQKGLSATYFQADVSKEGEVRTLFAKIIKLHGKLDILVNNAGIFLENQNELNQEEYTLVHKTSGWATYFCSKLMEKHVQNEGKIINISSIYADKPNISSIVAGAVKSEVNNYTKAFALKYKGKIDVNAVSPGYTDTRIVNNNFSKEQLTKAIKKTSLNRLLTTEEIAQAVLFLAKHNGITGQILAVDAGYNLGEIHE